MPEVKQRSDVPVGLRPYSFHGLDLTINNNHGVGDCPFCNKEGKFSIDCESGLWRCWSCGGGTDKGGGNPLTFIRMLHELSIDPSSKDFLEHITDDRRLCSINTIKAWGVCESAIIQGSCLVPGFNLETFKLDQLYKRTKIQDSDGKWSYRLLPTPGVWPEGKSHAIHLPFTDYDPSKPRPNVVICEGPWDGMALWEVCQNNQLGIADIIAVPGCNVWRDEWTNFCINKNVYILFDSDHPRQQGIRVYKAGHDGVQRIAKRLTGHAKSVSYLKWGKEGYDPDRPNGWDIRDALSGIPNKSIPLKHREIVLDELIKRIEHVPSDWFSPISSLNPTNGVVNNAFISNGSITTTVIESKPCSTWSECENAWKQAMHWRSDMSATLASILAVCASTRQSGNQLFMDIVGSPGVAKTTILRGALTSKHCVHVENITKLISGYKKAGEEEVDCSFIARSNNKTWITCEFDTILNSYQYNELMSKIRRIFDGETSSSYGNSDKDRVYSALRTPWIRAGTWKMMTQDQSQLGDRFLRVIINDPDEKEKRQILRSAIRSERSAMVEVSNGTSGGIVDPATRKAYALTGGYIDYLVSKVEEELQVVNDNIPEWVEDLCIDLAELSADMRARPNEDKRKKDNYDSKELPTRLARQNIRLAAHLSVVLNKKTIDSEVMKLVRKISLDTSFGHSLNICNWLCSINPKSLSKTYQECGGLPEITLNTWCNITEERMINLLMFLRKIDVLVLRKSSNNGSMWALTDRVHELYQRIRNSIDA